MSFFEAKAKNVSPSINQINKAQSQINIPWVEK